MKFFSFDIYPPIFLAGSIPCSIFCGSIFFILYHLFPTNWEKTKNTFKFV
jgi:hypothetical protein